MGYFSYQSSFQSPTDILLAASEMSTSITSSWILVGHCITMEPAQSVKQWAILVLISLATEASASTFLAHVGVNALLVMEEVAVNQVL